MVSGVPRRSKEWVFFIKKEYKIKFYGDFHELVCRIDIKVFNTSLLHNDVKKLLH